MNKKLSTLLAAGALVLGAQQASANTITVADAVSGAPSGGDFLWAYSATHSNGQINANEGKIVIYDFAGYIAGSNFEPANWAFSTQPVGGVNAGIDGTVNFFNPDSGSLLNLVWTYVGAAPIVTPFGVSLPLGLFGALSDYGIATTDYYGTQDRGLPDPITGTATLSGSLGPINVPALASVPDGGATAMLLGLGFLGIAGIRRKLS